MTVALAPPHTYTKPQVHRDDEEPYYTVRVHATGRERQTDANHLVRGLPQTPAGSGPGDGGSEHPGEVGDASGTGGGQSAETGTHTLVFRKACSSDTPLLLYPVVASLWAVCREFRTAGRPLTRRAGSGCGLEVHSLLGFGFLLAEYGVEWYVVYQPSGAPHGILLALSACDGTVHDQASA